MAEPASTRLRWQRHPVFRFFASLKLAVVLLAVLIIGAIAGTLYESTFDAKVARAYIYGAPWFNFWLILLAMNLAGSAFSRWPWRKHHTGFLVTHLGIITLLGGSLIGRIWGIEGTITLFKGQPPTNRLLVDQHQLRVHDSDGMVKGYPVEFINHKPRPDAPWKLGALASGAQMSVIDYAPAIEGTLNPKPLKDGGTPALHLTITTAKMGQHLESWLLADDAQHGTFNMGLAAIKLKRGAAAVVPLAQATVAPKPGEPVEIEETIFSFSKAPDQQIGKATKGGNTGAKVLLTAPENGNKGKVEIALGGQKWSFDVAENLGKDVAVEGSPFTLRVDNYWPDFRIENGKPGTISDQPNNPAAMITLRGRAIPTASPAADSHVADGAPPPMTGDNSLNNLTLFVAEDGGISYELGSRKFGKSSGPLVVGKGLPTGWADWELVVDQALPHAEEWMDFKPVATPPTGTELPDGLRIRVVDSARTFEQWVPAGWQVTVPVSPTPIEVAYGWKQLPLPIGLELTDFEVERNEGSDSPAGFKSTVRITTPEGDGATGQCWMNHPTSFPPAWWRTWTGLTFKLSQASWNPENLDQSTIQILRDPGWLFKWVGSILICSGIFTLFYLRPFRKPAAGPAPVPGKKSPRAKRERPLVSAEN